MRHHPNHLAVKWTSSSSPPSLSLSSKSDKEKATKGKRSTIVFVMKKVIMVQFFDQTFNKIEKKSVSTITAAREFQRFTCDEKIFTNVMSTEFGE